MNPNEIEPTYSIDNDWNLFLSHGIESTYVLDGESIKILVDHIKYLHVLIENCSGNNNVK
jgi:hypothetical protein